MQKITPFLWFDSQAEEAARLYTSVFKDSSLGDVGRYSAEASEAAGVPEGTAMTVSFQLGGTDFTALNGGPQFKFSEAISFVVTCKDQDEIDYHWDKLTADGGEESQCGWLRDKFGLSWQIVPENLGSLLRSPKAMQAMLKMKKLDVGELERASR